MSKNLWFFVDFKGNRKLLIHSNSLTIGSNLYQTCVILSFFTKTVSTISSSFWQINPMFLFLTFKKHLRTGKLHRHVQQPRFDYNEEPSTHSKFSVKKKLIQLNLSSPLIFSCKNFQLQYTCFLFAFAELNLIQQSQGN